MNTLKEYYKIEFVMSCGIPEIILVGSQEDWNKIKIVFEKMKKVMSTDEDCELKHWIPCMDLVLTMFIDLRMMALNGKVDAPKKYKLLWDRVITFVPRGSGSGEMLGGWISVLSPYSTKNTVKGIFINLPCLDVERTVVKSNNVYENQDIMKEFYGGVGWKTVQTTMFSTPATFKDLDGSECDIQISAGINVNPHVNDREEVGMNIGYEIHKKNQNFEKKKVV